MLPYIFWAIALLAQQTFADEPEPIVGGSPANPGEFPHQCSLRTYYGSHFCGCSIIAPNRILTAAHCVEGESAHKIRVVTATIGIYTGTSHNVKEIVIHPQYSNKQQDAWKNDVAVLILQSPMQYNAYQKAIPLASSTPSANQICTLAGWGQVGADKPPSKELLKINQRIVSKSECQNRHYGMPLTPGHLCALSAYGSGGCMGDSGGPLISNGVQVGLISWVSPCGRGYPDVFSDVSYYRNWILSV